MTPLIPAMRRAMAERDVTFRGLAAITAEQGVRDGRGLASGFLGAVARGIDRPSLDTIEAICAALELDPATILEYRLGQVRMLFDPRPAPVGVGPDEALTNLERFGFVEAAMPDGELDGLPGAPGELGRDLRDQQPTAQSPGRTDRRIRDRRRKPA